MQLHQESRALVPFTALSSFVFCGLLWPSYPRTVCRSAHGPVAPLRIHGERGWLRIRTRVQDVPWQGLEAKHPAHRPGLPGTNRSVTPPPAGMIDCAFLAHIVRARQLHSLRTVPASVFMLLTLAPPPHVLYAAFFRSPPCSGLSSS